MQTTAPGNNISDASGVPFSFDFKARGPTPKGNYGNVTGGQASAAQVFGGIPPHVEDAIATRATQVADVAGDVLPASSGGYQLNFENADVAAVSKAILGDILKANYLLDKRVNGQITLTSSQPVPRSRLVPLLESSLALIGAAVVKDQDLYRIVPSADPGGIGRVDRSGTPEGFGTSVITARFLPAATLGHLLEGFGTRAGSVRVDAATNLVIVQGTANERRSALEAAQSVDVDWLRSKSVAILPVANSSPETIIAELNHVLDSGEGGLAQGAVQLEPMSQLNAVLVVARRKDGVDLVQKWVTRLDRVDANAASVKVYRLAYAQAKTVATALNDLFGTGSSAGNSSDRDLLEPSGQGASQTSSPSLTRVSTQGASNNAPQTDAATAANIASSSPFGALKTAMTDASKKDSSADADTSRGATGTSKIRVTPDPTTNSLLINASPSEYKLVERAIRQMDRPPVQVDIEATIAEVTLTQDLQYGIQFFLQHGKTSLGLSGAEGIPIQPLNPAGVNLTLGGLSNPRVIIDALQSMTSVKILSSPSLVVLDRQPAVLQVGDQVPILTRTAQSVDNTLAPVVNNVDYKDTGIILNVLPRVNANGVVTLDIEQEISAVSSTDPTSLTPTISQRRVKSSVAVANGQTVMLAGLISDKQSSNRSGLPGVGSIQFLNDILTSHDTAANRTEIVIFIKPQIISGSADAEQVTEEFHNRLLSIQGASTATARPVVRKY